MMVRFLPTPTMQGVCGSPGALRQANSRTHPDAQPSRTCELPGSAAAAPGVSPAALPRGSQTERSGLRAEAQPVPIPRTKSSAYRGPTAVLLRRGTGTAPAPA